MKENIQPDRLLALFSRRMGNLSRQGVPGDRDSQGMAGTMGKQKPAEPAARNTLWMPPAVHAGARQIGGVPHGLPNSRPKAPVYGALQ